MATLCKVMHYARLHIACCHTVYFICYSVMSFTRWVEEEYSVVFGLTPLIGVYCL